MLFCDKKEINYELYFKHTTIRVLSNKESKTNKYLYLIKPYIKIFFWFKKIKEEDLNLSKLFNHLIFLWLITGQRAIIKGLNSVLNKGIRYFRYIYYLDVENVFNFYNFLNETLLPIIQKNSKKVHYKKPMKFLCSFADLGSFTNLRLSSNLYLNSVHDKLYVFIRVLENLNINLNLYLSCLKI